MRYILFALVGLIVVSCSNELDLTADYKETPVVYGILNPADTAQYVRVERTFIDEKVAASVLAKNPDSLYYNGITVKVIRSSNGQEYTLNRVDGNEEGYIRQEGIFAQAPNYLYKIKTEEIALVPEELYELKIEGIFEDKAVTASTSILKTPFFATPQDDAEVAFTRGKLGTYGWNPKGGEASTYAVTFYFNIEEVKDGVTTAKKLTWRVAPNTKKTTLEILGTNFYSFMAGALEKDPSVKRYFKSGEFELASGNSDIGNYLNVTQANLGITSSGEIPVFSNIDGGLGLFGSKVTDRRTGLKLRSTTRDSLINSVITKDLNFQ